MPRCPSCFTPLTRVEEHAIKSAVCSNCYGTWINEGALLRITRLEAQQISDAAAGKVDAASAPTLPELAEIVQSSNSSAILRCGQCEKPMVKERFNPLIPVQIDRCRACRYVWLDVGELPLLRRLYVELLTTDDPEIQRRRDKVASVAAQWQSRKWALQDSKEIIQSQIGDDTIDPFDMFNHLMRSI